MTNVSRKHAMPAPDEAIGFIGLGVMGQPMALNLARAGTKLIVWNRTPAAIEPLKALGATAASSVDEVFERARIVFLMLINETVLDLVLRRKTADFAKLVSGHVVVSMGSNPPDYSCNLASDISAAGGKYVEAPVSGSRKPAELAQLVSLISGEADIVTEVRPLVSHMCHEIVFCGPVGNALLMKLTVNLFLNTMLAGMAEAVHFAARHNLDLNTLKAAIDSGPMDCDFTRIKIPKLISRDFSVQAATADAFNSTRLIAEAAREAQISSPMLELASDLYGESVSLGNGRLDMSSVLEAIEARSKALDRPFEALSATKTFP